MCIACASPDACVSNGTCDLDPAATWRVRVSAINTTSWDATSSSDIEVRLWCPSSATSVSATMPKVQDNNSPRWTTGGCTLTAGEILAEGIAFDVRDEDVTGYDTVQPRTNVTISASNLRAGSLNGNTGNLSLITFTFTKL